MAAKVKWTPERLDEIRSLAETGLNAQEIADKTGENYNAICALKRTAGIMFYSRYTKWSKELIEEIDRQMKAGLSHKEIAAKLNIPYHMVPNISRNKIKEPLTYSQKMARITAKRKRLAPSPLPKYVKKATIQEDDLIRRIKAMLRGRFDWWIKEDVIQEVALHVLEGATLDSRLIRSAISKYTSGAHREVSFDAPYYQDGRALKDILPDLKAFDPSD